MGTRIERQCGPDGMPVNAWRARCTCGWAGPVHRGTHPNQRLYRQEAAVDSSRHRQDDHEEDQGLDLEAALEALAAAVEALRARPGHLPITCPRAEDVVAAAEAVVDAHREEQG